MQIFSAIKIYFIPTVALLVSVMFFSPALLAQPVYEGDPPPPPLRNLMADKNVQKKMLDFEKACRTRLSKATCVCVSRNMGYKMNGRDLDESDLDMIIAIAARKNQKKFADLDTYDFTLDMIEGMESECVKNSKWEMDH